MGGPTALGAYIFAGGFTLGVEKHFEVLGHLEGSAYGVSTARLNWPELPIFYPKEEWPVDRLRGRVDFLYCNPPCAVFSTMGIATTRGPGSWRSDPRTECWRNADELAGELLPRAYAIESVCQAYGTGRELVDELTRRAMGRGYSVTHLFINAKWHGLPQQRKRFFFLAHRAGRFSGYQHNYPPPPTLREAFSDLSEPGTPLKMWERVRPLVQAAQPGERLSSVFDRLHPPDQRPLNAHGKVAGRPSFLHRRVDLDTVMGAFTSDTLYHPDEERMLGENELKRICGYPLDFKLDGSRAEYGGLLARAVMPPVGEWLARAVADTIEQPPAPAPTVTYLDLREPGKAPVDCTVNYQTTTSYPSLTPEPKEETMPKRAEDEPVEEMEEVETTEEVGEEEHEPLIAGNKDPAREFDTTSMPASVYGYRVHRDYAAHFFRWGWVGRLVEPHWEVLDVGCGKDTPFVRSANGIEGRCRLPKRYVGVDLNDLKGVPQRFWTTYHGNFNFIKRYRELGTFDLVINLEVIEHMTKEYGRQMLRGIARCLKPGGMLALSTPVFNGKAAKNHIHEYTIPELHSLLTETGFTVVKRFGTFANQNDLKKVASQQELAVMRSIGAYYDDSVVACFLAPLYPDAARNNVWLCQHSGIFDEAGDDFRERYREAVEAGAEADPLDNDFGPVTTRRPAPAGDPLDNDFGPVAKVGPGGAAPDQVRQEPAPTRATRSVKRGARPARAAATPARAPAGAPEPDEGQGSGSYIRALLVSDRFTPNEIVALVHQHYEGRKTTVKDVKWNYDRMRAEGVKLPAWSGPSAGTYPNQPGSKKS